MFFIEYKIRGQLSHLNVARQVRPEVEVGYELEPRCPAVLHDGHADEEVDQKQNEKDEAKYGESGHLGEAVEKIRT